MPGFLRQLAPRTVIAVACFVVVTLVVAHGADRTPAAARRGTQLSGPTAVAHSSRTFRIATFNIHSGVGLDRQADLARTARCLRGFDLVGLNEVRSGGLGGAADQAAQLGQQLRQAWLFAPAEHQWWHDHFGNAVVTTLPVGQWERIPLAGTRGKGFRNLVRLNVDIAGHPVTVLVTHIDRMTDRQAQLEFVIDDFLCQPNPAVLMGDLNTRSDDSQLTRLRAAPGVTDCLTQCSAATPETIDWIFIRGLECHAAGLRDEAASDHPLAWAELSLPATSNSPSPLKESAGLPSRRGSRPLR